MARPSPTPPLRSLLPLAALGLGLGLGALPAWPWREPPEAEEVAARATLERRLGPLAAAQDLEAALAALQRETGNLRQETEALRALGAGEADTWRTRLRKLQEAQAGLQAGLAELGARLESGAASPQAAPAGAERAAQRRHRLQREILEPVVRLSGGSAAGSAVLIARETGPEAVVAPAWLALSSSHVIRDILGEDLAFEELCRLPLEAVVEREGELHLQAFLVAEDRSTDLALLRIPSRRSLEPVARLAPRERLLEIETFTPVYTTGCPLGTAPQATRGEITRLGWEVDGQSYWMISAPAYFGNSGGGVFLEETGELAGVFSKIYTHGSLRPQVVTHMGLAVPLDVVHAWLEELGLRP